MQSIEPQIFRIVKSEFTKTNMVEGSHGTHEKRSTAAVEDYPLARLEDPLDDRVMKDVPTPPKYPLSVENLF